MSLVLNILRGLSPRYGHLKAILKRQKPFPTFEQVRSDLLLEELESTADTATATTLYSATWTAPSDSGGGGGAPPSSPPLSAFAGLRSPSSGFQLRRWWWQPRPQGRWQGSSRWWPCSSRQGWRLVAILLQPVDRRHLYVAGAVRGYLCATPYRPTADLPCRSTTDGAPGSSTPVGAPSASGPSSSARVGYLGWRVGPTVLQHDDAGPAHQCH
jgi:hypothetical protein